MTMFPVKAGIVALVSGVMFGIGLCFAGMGQPSTVVGFLDFFGGSWNPSLALLMAAGIPVTAVGYALARRRGTSVFGGSLPTPAKTAVDARLVIGSALFGVGWAIGGRCPGPGFLGLGTATIQAFLFVGAMVAGMYAFTKFEALVLEKRLADETGQPAVR